VGVLHLDAHPPDRRGVYVLRGRVTRYWPGTLEPRGRRTWHRVYLDGRPIAGPFWHRRDADAWARDYLEQMGAVA
jgi:hypothetical protein